MYTATVYSQSVSITPRVCFIPKTCPLPQCLPFTPRVSRVYHTMHIPYILPQFTPKVCQLLPECALFPKLVLYPRVYHSLPESPEFIISCIYHVYCHSLLPKCVNYSQSELLKPYNLVTFIPKTCHLPQSLPFTPRVSRVYHLSQSLSCLLLSPNLSFTRLLIIYPTVYSQTQSLKS